MYQMELITVAMTDFVEESIHKISEWSLLGCWMDYTLCTLVSCTNQEQRTHQLDHTHSMGQCPSGEANRSSVRKEIPSILWKTEVHYCIHNSLPPDTVLSQIKAVHAPSSHFLKINFNIIFQSTPRSSSPLFPSGFSTTTLNATILAPLCATFPTHPILLDLIT